MAAPKRASLKDEAAQSRYRRVSTRMWNDHRVRELGHPEPHPMYLFMYLLTNPATTGVPGLFRARDIAMAMDLGWSLEDFRGAFAVLQQQGMAEADWRAGLVWLPNAVKHDPPASPNVVVSWGKIVRNDMPECRLLLRAVTRIREQLGQLFERPEGFLEAFAKAFPEAFTKGLAKAFPEGFEEAFPKAFPEGPAEVAGDRANGGGERLPERLPESLTRTPTRAQPDAGRPSISSLRSDHTAPQAVCEPSPPGSTDARARQEPQPPTEAASPGASPPALRGAGTAQDTPAQAGPAPVAPVPDPKPVSRRPSPGSMLSEAERREREDWAAIERASAARMARLPPIPEPMTEPPDEPGEDDEPDWDAIAPMLAARASLPDGVEA